MIDIPESKLSRAQADIEPRLNARVNCGPVNDVLWTAISPSYQRNHIDFEFLSFDLKVFGCVP